MKKKVRIAATSAHQIGQHLVELFRLGIGTAFWKP
jgi:hypothetical protein